MSVLREYHHFVLALVVYTETRWMTEATPGVLELCGGEVRCWAERGEPVILRAASGVDPVELTADEARRLASQLLKLADWCDDPSPPIRARKP